MKRYLTGIKATNNPHIGNMLGAIEPAISKQNDFETFYFIANYHSLTSVKKADELREYTYEVAAVWLALGLDPDKSVFYRQSDVPQSIELAWMLSSVVSMGDLFRAHTFKAAKDKNEEGAMNHATFAYPVLMAADIILFDADIVPVGQDQLQHLEMARAAARRFNHLYGENVLKEPSDLVSKEVGVVPGIDGQKMSKSYGNGIHPFLSPKELKKEVMNIVTDSKGLEDKKDPENCNIFTLFRLFASQDEQNEMAECYRKGGYGYGHAKLALLEKIEAHYGEARGRFNELMANKPKIDAILDAGAAKARPIADEVLRRTRAACGID